MPETERHVVNRHVLHVVVWAPEQLDDEHSENGRIVGTVAHALGDHGLSVDVTHVSVDSTSARIEQERTHG